ncbi:MAG: hypothetical protein IPP08_12755 [Chlorobiota bacterium]|nr:MAG: hypothetical protein IPP08_12755 [Chlorobiota bacterium]
MAGKQRIEHRDDLSQYAPRLTTMMVPVEMIGALIGSGGETIRSIKCWKVVQKSIFRMMELLLLGAVSGVAAKAIQK